MAFGELMIGVGIKLGAGDGPQQDLATQRRYAFSLAIRLTTAAILPPALLPTTASREPSTLIFSPYSATYSVAA